MDGLKMISESQAKYLWSFNNDDELTSTIKGYYWAERCEKVNKGTLNALLRKGFLEQKGVGVGVGLMEVDVGITKEGKVELEKYEIRYGSLDTEMRARWGHR